MEISRGAKISMENLRGAKISVENLRGAKNVHYFPKNTPTGYPDLKKTGPLVSSKSSFRINSIPHLGKLWTTFVNFGQMRE